MDQERYKRLVSDIQALSQVEVEEIFRIIHESKCGYTRNNNGIFVNLAWLHPTTIEQIEKYVRFCNASKRELTKYESLCDVLNHKMHQYHDSMPAANAKAVATHTGSGAGVTGTQGDADAEKMNGSKMSSSMRYYLLKKRYSKQQVLSTSQTDFLTNDSYVQDTDA
jgi:hypothetical protein